MSDREPKPGAVSFDQVRRMMKAAMQADAEALALLPEVFEPDQGIEVPLDEQAPTRSAPPRRR